MAKINIIETRVKELLENVYETRNSDELLYVTYLETYHYIDFGKNVFVNYKEYNLPSFKTIERARRKLQEKYSYLEAELKTEENRKYKETEYKEYYKN